MIGPDYGSVPAPKGAGDEFVVQIGLTEQAQDVLRRLVCDGQRLGRKLLLDLQRLQACGLFFHVRINHRTDAGVEAVGQIA